MQPVAPEPIRHHAPGIFVDDLHLALAHDVVLVAAHQMDRGQRLNNELLALNSVLPRAAETAGELSQLVDRARGQFNAAVVAPDPVVTTRGQGAGAVERLTV